MPDRWPMASAARRPRRTTSVLVRRIDPIGEPPHRRPFEDAVRPARGGSVGVVRLLDHLARRQQDVFASAHGERLRAACALQAVGVIERLADARADRERAVVPQQHHVGVTQIGDQPLALLELDRDTLVVVIGDLLEAQRGLGHWQQAALERGHGHSGDRVRVDHAVNRWLRPVNRAVDDVARWVELVAESLRKLRLPQHVPVEVHLDQRGGAHLVVHHAERVKEKLLLARDPRRDVVVDEVVHAEVAHEPIRARTVDAGLPLGRADLAFQRLELERWIVLVGRELWVGAFDVFERYGGTRHAGDGFAESGGGHGAVSLSIRTSERQAWHRRSASATPVARPPRLTAYYRRSTMLGTRYYREETA